MKKLFLFLGAALFSLGVSAQEEYYVTVENEDFVIGADNNIDITSQISAKLQKEDWVIVTVKGYFDCDIQSVGVWAIADNSYKEDEPKESQWWRNLTAWKAEQIGSATSAKTLFEATWEVEITEDAYTNDKVVIRMAPLNAELAEGTKVKLRPTPSFDAGATYPVAMASTTFGSSGDGKYKAEIPFTTTEALKKGDAVKLTIDGTFNQNISDGLSFMIFEEAKEVLPYMSLPFSATADELKTGTTFEFTMPKAGSGTEYKLQVYVEGYDAEKPLTFLKEGETAHDPVELANKEYTNVTLNANIWTDPTPGSNYQYKENIASGVFSGDYVTFSIKGTSDSEIELLRAYLQNDKYMAISEYVEVAKSVEKDGSVEYTGKVTVATASDVCILILEVPSEAAEGSAIIIKGSNDIPDAVEEVSASSFAVVGGMVYSAGEIVVYNVAGKAIATASQSFNVNTLEAGVYFITAQEGTIKFVK